MIEALIEQYGEPVVSLAGGGLLGLIFGAMAMQSRFCMRSAVIGLARHGGDAALALWLLAVGVAIVGVQGVMLAGWVQAETIRPLTSGGSLSGAMIGGVLFGAGMVLARGCVSRLLVLSAAGNLRAVVTGLIFLGIAYATMKGPLGEARSWLASLLPLEGAARLDMTEALGFGRRGAVVSGLVMIAVALVIGYRQRLGFGRATLGALIGLAVAGTYGFTALLNSASFDPQPVRGLSFIAPSVNAASFGLSLPGGRLDFDTGLILGVLAGAFVVALAARKLRLEWFASPRAALRYVTGAALMGFGGVVAGGCSMGNGVSGWAIYSTTALIALGGMWLGALVTDALVDRPAVTMAEPAVNCPALETASVAFRH